MFNSGIFKINVFLKKHVLLFPHNLRKAIIRVRSTHIKCPIVICSFSDVIVIDDNSGSVEKSKFTVSSWKMYYFNN